MPVADSAFHWQPVRSTKKMASAHCRSGTRGRPPPKRWVFLCGGKSGSIKAQSSSLSLKRPPVLGMRLARGRDRGLTSSAVFISAKDTTKSVIRIGPKLDFIHFLTEEALKMSHLRRGRCVFLMPDAYLDSQKSGKSTRNGLILRHRLG